MIASVFSYSHALWMGLLQGVTELFPVSSLGHGVLVPFLFHWHDITTQQSQGENPFLAFLVALHVGTALGLIAYYRQTWSALVGGTLRAVRATRTRGVASLWRLADPTTDPHYRTLALLVLGTIPVGVVGLAFEHKLRVLFAKPLAAAIFLTINALVMAGGELVRRRSAGRVSATTLASLSPRTALLVGASQILALFAGISRSGTAMTAGLLGGLDHEEAANFSFLLATPVILLAGVYKIPDLLGHLGDGLRPQAFAAAVVAGVAAFGATKFLTKWFATRTLWPFAIYCAVAGIASWVHFAH
jgi:undecaprenyl-diphosphatase